MKRNFRYATDHLRLIDYYPYILEESICHLRGAWLMVSFLIDLSLSGPPGFNCWTSVAPAFQNWFAFEYLSCFISVMNLYSYVRCFDSLMSRCPSCGPNNFYVYINHNRT